MSMTFNCEFNLHPQGYDCKVSNQRIIANENVVIFKGKHESGKTNDDVKNFFFMDCLVPQIPQNIGETFGNLEVLSINFAKIQSITKKDLKQLRNLKVLNLIYNDLEFLPGDLFEFIPQIERISFSDNKIKFIGPALLENLPHLRTAMLSINKTIDKIYSKDLDHNHYTNRISLDELKLQIQTHCKPPICEQDLHKIYGRNLNERTAIPKDHGFLADLQKFILKGELRDFTIIIGTREFKVHKFIFMARSETFAELIKNNPDAEDLVLQDISVEVFESILKFIYNDQIPETQNIIEVFAAAGKLKIKGLMNITADKLINSMEEEKNLEILFKILSFANKFEHEELKLNAFQEIKKQFPFKTLKNELAGQLDVLKKLIDAKMLLDQLGVPGTSNLTV